MHRLGYSLIAAHGSVLLTWSEPIQHIRMPYANAYAFAKQLVTVGQQAETQAGLTVDRTGPPDPVHTKFRPEGGDVLMDMGVFQQTFLWPPGLAFAMANALVQTGELAQRWMAKGPGMSPKEVDQIEAAILGEPRLVPEPTPAPAPARPGVPLVGETYFYRPALALARVLAVATADHRADILLATGAVLQGVAWSDLLHPDPARRGGHARALGLPSQEALGRPSLG